MESPHGADQGSVQLDRALQESANGNATPDRMLGKTILDDKRLKQVKLHKNSHKNQNLMTLHPVLRYLLKLQLHRSSPLYDYLSGAHPNILGTGSQLKSKGPENHQQQINLYTTRLCSTADFGIKSTQLSPKGEMWPRVFISAFLLEFCVNFSLFHCLTASFSWWLITLSFISVFCLSTCTILKLRIGRHIFQKAFYQPLFELYTAESNLSLMLCLEQYPEFPRPWKVGHLQPQG